MKEKQVSPKKSEWFKNPLILGSIILSIWIISGVLVFQILDSWENRGTFGDMFGAVNSLFSGLALAGIIYTIFLQRSELELQRKELELNRKELARSAKAQENSEKELRRQADNLKSTARLNALGTLMNYHLDNINRKPNSSHGHDERQIEHYKIEIEEILKGKS